MFAGPLMVLLFTQSLPWLVSTLTVGRWLAAALHWYWCRKALPSRTRASLPQSNLRSALHEGLWITVSNVVGPLMVVFDRFVLAAVAGLAAALKSTSSERCMTGSGDSRSSAGVASASWPSSDCTRFCSARVRSMAMAQSLPPTNAIERGWSSRCSRIQAPSGRSSAREMM
jgi:hypothetical protein